MHFFICCLDITHSFSFLLLGWHLQFQTSAFFQQLFGRWRFDSFSSVRCSSILRGSNIEKVSCNQCILQTVGVVKTRLTSKAGIHLKVKHACQIWWLRSAWAKLSDTRQKMGHKCPVACPPRALGLARADTHNRWLNCKVDGLHPCFMWVDLTVVGVQEVCQISVALGFLSTGEQIL